MIGYRRIDIEHIAHERPEARVPGLEVAVVRARAGQSSPDSSRRGSGGS